MARKYLSRLAAMDVDMVAAMESLNEGIGLADKYGRVHYVNDRLAEMIGLPPEELLGHKTSDHYFASGSAEWKAEAARMEQRYVDRLRGKCEVYENEILRKDGSRRILETKASPLRNRSGEVVGSIGAVTDVTERRALEEALRDANRKKDDFLAMLAHELRNPMAAISASVEALLSHGVEEDKAQYAKDVLRRRVRQLSRLVDDMLDVSRIVRGKTELCKEQVNLRTVISGAVEVTKSHFAERSQVLMLADSKDLHVYGDPMRLEQVLNNLLTNASRYTPEQGTISLRVKEENGGAVITVRDNGIGMPQELLPKIFDLFTQADGSLHRTSGGLGIGLFVAKRLIEMHDGTLTAESDGPGKGSQFTLTLPLHDESAIASCCVEPRTGGAGTLSILLAEDNRDTAILTAALLEHEGHGVDIVFDGPSALRRLEEKSYDVLLLDIGLPVLDGYEVSQEIQKRNIQNLLVVAVSGYGQDKDLARSKESGIHHHLLKPIDYEKLGTLLSLHHSRLMHGELHTKEKCRAAAS